MLYSILLYGAVLFVGGIVAATVELISLDDDISRPVHSYGTVSRWIIMYPTYQPITLVGNTQPWMKFDPGSIIIMVYILYIVSAPEEFWYKLSV